jgi:hypothetical protein
MHFYGCSKSYETQDISAHVFSGVSPSLLDSYIFNCDVKDAVISLLKGIENQARTLLLVEEAEEHEKPKINSEIKPSCGT